MSETVLITGAFGLVGQDTVKRFAADGWRVIAMAHRNVDAGWPPGVEVRRADLTEPGEVESLMAEVSPDAVVHLAAVIPPLIYRDAKFARNVNVDATAALLRAAERQPKPPRFLHASSGAVYGGRNPHRYPDRVDVDTALRPCELYGGHKLEAERLVRASNLDWVMLRLGGVLSVDPTAMPLSTDILYFGSALPADGRVHGIDTRDVATAFAAAATADKSSVVGETLLIAGDDTHLLRQDLIGSAMAAAQGMVGFMPAGRPGDPDSDDGWYPGGEWMQVERAQQLLKFQRHSWPEMLDEMRARAGWKRYPTRVVAPLARQVVKRHAAYRKAPPAPYADVWNALRARFGDTSIDTA